MTARVQSLLALSSFLSVAFRPVGRRKQSFHARHPLGASWGTGSGEVAIHDPQLRAARCQAAAHVRDAAPQRRELGVQGGLILDGIRSGCLRLERRGTGV